MNSKNIIKLTFCIAGVMIAAAVYIVFYNDGRITHGTPAAKEGHAGGSSASQAATGSGSGGTAGQAASQQAGVKVNGKPAAGTMQSQAPLAPVIPQDVQAATGTAVAGAPEAVARVTVNGQQQSLTPNEIGNYPKVYIEQKATVPVTISFPKGDANDPVLVYTPDGGHINDRQNGGKALYLDRKKTINFNFEANADRGLYRVVVTKGSETTVMQFWAGAETPYATR